MPLSYCDPGSDQGFSTQDFTPFIRRKDPVIAGWILSVKGQTRLGRRCEREGVIVRLSNFSTSCDVELPSTVLFSTWT